MNNQDLINEIRSKVDIVDIISSYIPLVQKGKNFFGVCPFHDDNNPSMSVSRELQIYRCFSCGASGNVYKFIMDYEHITFKEALKLLAAKTGIELKGTNFKETTNKYSKFYDIYNLANKFYQNNLNTKLGLEAKKYLKNRNITDEVIKKFEIGLSLGEQGDLTKLLLEKGYDNKTLNISGLTNDTKDVFINRITFPLYDITGKVIGFSGRIYDNSKINKYLNTKETPIFKKGELLYNYHNAKEEVRLKKSVIIMEGFMDVIRAWTIGVTNTVALMGTAMTKEQANLIKRLSNNVIFCLDGDDAGRNATLTNGEVLLNLGLEVQVAPLPKELDPDTYITTKGEDKFLNIINNAINYSDYKIKLLKDGINLNSDKEKADYINKVLEETSKIDDEIRREIILKNIAKEFDLEYNTLEKRLVAILTKLPSKEKTIKVEEVVQHKANKYDYAENAILYYMLNNNEDVFEIYESTGIHFPKEQSRYLASEIAYYKKKYGFILLADFMTYLTDKLELEKLLSEVLSIEIDPNVSKEVIMDYLNVINNYNMSREIKRLQKLVEQEIDPIEKAKIAEKIRKLKMGS